MRQRPHQASRCSLSALQISQNRVAAPPTLPCCWPSGFYRPAQGSISCRQAVSGYLRQRVYQAWQRQPWTILMPLDQSRTKPQVAAERWLVAVQMPGSVYRTPLRSLQHSWEGQQVA